MTANYPYVWRWRRVQILDTGEYRQHPFSDRVGTRCRVIARGKLSSAAVEFEADGHRAMCHATRSGRPPHDRSHRSHVPRTRGAKPTASAPAIRGGVAVST